MIGNRKKFNTDLYNTYDRKGKDAVIKLVNSVLSDKDITTIENPHQYGIDVLSIDGSGSVVYAWEVEVRYGNWKNDTKFGYPDINCIERKEYMWERTERFHNDIPYPVSDDCRVFYVQLNEPCTWAAIIDADLILQYPQKRSRNRFASGEMIRSVPIEKIYQVKIPT